MHPAVRSVLLVARLLLTLVFVPHALGKIVAFDAFAEKFGLPTVLIALLCFSELAGVVGVLLGGIVREPFARWMTWLGALSIAVGQVAAVVVVHAPRWFVYSGGMEFNVVLIGLCLMLVLGHRHRLVL
ncbi:MAG: hypothetical protein L0I76_18355 [Pseudonocardia sp.]|nr:hypothetical protein [Pseudonocardia sp.]